VERLHGFEKLLLYLETTIEAVDEPHGELFVLDWSTNVTELVGGTLEFAARPPRPSPLGPLDDVVELLVEVDLAPFRILGEEVLQRVLGGVVGLKDDVLELIGDGGVDPEHDVDVDGAPLRVGQMRISLLLDVVAGVVLGEDDEEEVAPFVVVPDLRVELALDVASNVNTVGTGSRGKQLNRCAG
jgi:hypothetical protein